MRWPALGRSLLRLLGDRLLRCLLALGSMTPGAPCYGWHRSRGECWWEGAVPARGAALGSVIAATRIEPGALDHPGVRRGLRSLRGSQDTRHLGGPAGAAPDPAPAWHPERRPARSPRARP